MEKELLCLYPDAAAINTRTSILIRVRRVKHYLCRYLKIGSYDEHCCWKQGLSTSHSFPYMRRRCPWAICNDLLPRFQLLCSKKACEVCYGTTEVIPDGHGTHDSTFKNSSGASVRADVYLRTRQAVSSQAAFYAINVLICDCTPKYPPLSESQLCRVA